MRPGRKYPRGKYWSNQSVRVWNRCQEKCEITGASLRIFYPDPACPKPFQTPLGPLYFGHWKRKWACHHILSERMARKWIPGCDPHILENLVAITPSLHSKITAIEAKLSKTDWLGFRTELHRLGFPLERLDAAFAALCQSVKSRGS